MSFFSNLFKPGKRQFARDVEAAFGEHAPGTMALVAREVPALAILIGEECGGRSLAELYARYREADPKARAELLRELATKPGLDEAKPFLEIYGDKVLPRIVSASFENLAVFEKAIRGKELVELDDLRKRISLTAGAPFAEGLATDYVIDLEGDKVSLAPATAARWKIADPLQKKALENLRARSNGAWESPSKGVWRSPWKDGNDPARLLLPGLVETLKVRGRPVAIAASPNTLIVFGDEDVEAAAAALGLALEAFDAHPLSMCAVVFDGGKWIDWAPDDDTDIFEIAVILTRKELHTFYALQKEVLSPRFLLGHVATYALEPGEDGEESLRESSFAAWPRMIEGTWLPDVERVKLFEGSVLKPKIVADLFFDDLHELAPGCLVKEEGLEPPLWRTARWPTQAEIDAIMAREAAEAAADEQGSA